MTAHDPGAPVAADPPTPAGQAHLEPAALRGATAADLDRVADVVGASFHLADLDRFRNNYVALRDAFRAHYPNTQLGYSYKTNYLPGFIRAANDLGAWSEVVSRMEFDYARRLGVPADRILFNGPVKQVADIRHGVVEGGVVILDNLGEVDDLLGLAGRADHPVEIALRCQLGPATPRSRFGMDIETDDFQASLQRLDDHPNVRVVGLHTHHSGDRAAERYADRMRRLIDAHDRVFAGREVRFLDLGGGFASAMAPSLAAQLGEVPDFEEYADAVAPQMHEAYGPDGPQLILEPGMALLADAMAFVTRVQRLKEVGGRRVAVVDGTVFNVKPLRGAVNLPIQVVPSDRGHDDARVGHGPWDVVGHTCMEIDVLHEGHDGPLGVGDHVVVFNSGAYSNVLNAPFIRPLPGIVDVSSITGRPRVLRAPSTVDDLVDGYREPPAHDDAPIGPS